MSTFKTNKYDYPFLQIRIDDSRESIISQFIIQDISRLIRRTIKLKLFEKTNSLEYHCFVCQKKLFVDISSNVLHGKRIDVSSFLCESHQHYRIDENSLSFFRYENQFYKKLKSHLQKENLLQNDQDFFSDI